MHKLSSLVIVLDHESPCPYIDGQVARMPLEMSRSQLTPEQFDHLLENGYRRSGNFFYHTRCPTCQACQPLRLDVNQFVETKSMRRVRRRGDQHLEMRIGPPQLDDLRVELFNRHRSQRNLARNEGFASEDEYESFLIEASLDVWELSFWRDSRLIAVSITDVGHQSLSAVYCYFDPEFQWLSPGTYSILNQIALARSTNRRWLYLGMYVASNPHLRYKARFGPHQRFVANDWQSEV